MATIEKRGTNQWRAKVRLRGRTASKTFTRRADAQAWITETEAKIRRESQPHLPNSSKLVLAHRFAIVRG